MSEFKEKLSMSKEVFDGKIIRVTVDTVTLKNGNSATREVVHHNGGAAILALNDKREVALIRQYRYAQQAEIIEIPAGKIEIGEKPMETAVRELEEEAGLLADHWHDLGYIIPTCAYCTELIYLFYATGLHFTRQHLDSDEFLSVFWLPLFEAVEMVMRGEITDSKTVTALLKLEKLLK